MRGIRNAVPFSCSQEDPQQNSSRGWVENGGTGGVDDDSGRIVLSPIGSRSGTLLHAPKLRYDPVSRVSNTLSRRRASPVGSQFFPRYGWGDGK